MVKQESEGTFESVSDLIDQREPKVGDIVLPECYEVSCGVNGDKLSFEQKQKLTIARALIRDPKILLLDEATSAMDEESQATVLSAFKEKMREGTMLVVAHRLAMIEKCAHVAVIDDGKVIEEGSFDELGSKSDGHFATLIAILRKKERKERELKA